LAIAATGIAPPLDFAASGHIYATHGLHAFAARLPAPLANWAINEYTDPGENVVDPMCGSGTAVLEAYLLGRYARGLDIDPLSWLIASAKVAGVSGAEIEAAGLAVLAAARASSDPGWRPDGIDVSVWFRDDVAADLARLRHAIARADVSEGVRIVLSCLFSSLIVARTSVANVRDIAHSRHHFQARSEDPGVMDRYAAKVRAARRLYEDRDVRRQGGATAAVAIGDARALVGIPSGQASLYFSSPPYCSALDYTRAHIFSVAWLPDILGTTTEAYRTLGRSYVGSERAALNEARPGQPDPPALDIHDVDKLVAQLVAKDRERSWIVYRYFRDMAQVLDEAARVVRPNGHVVLVVCPSNIRNVSIPTDELFKRLAERGGQLELESHVSRIINDRRRLMPYLEASFGKRMRSEYVLVWKRRRDASVA
jgi:SAM-dependent methyltransferase